MSPISAVGVHRALAGVLTVTALLLAGCGLGNDIHGYLDDSYQLQNRSGDTATYFAGAPVGATTAAIAGAVVPAARQADGGSEYLRYDDDIVIVSAAGGGSNVRVEDLDGNYSRGHYVFLGPGFNPGSPAGGMTSGGPGDSK